MHIVHHGLTAAAEFFGDEVKYFLKHKAEEVNGKISQVSLKLSPSLEMYVFHLYFIYKNKIYNIKCVTQSHSTIFRPEAKFVTQLIKLKHEIANDGPAEALKEQLETHAQTITDIISNENG